MQFTSIWIENEYARIPGNMVLLLEREVCLPLQMADGLITGEIGFNRNEFAGGKIRELRLIENFASQLLAPWTPVRAGEEKENKFVFLFGLFLCSFEIAGPFETFSSRKLGPGHQNQ